MVKITKETISNLGEKFYSKYSEDFEGCYKYIQRKANSKTKRIMEKIAFKELLDIALESKNYNIMNFDEMCKENFDLISSLKLLYNKSGIPYYIHFAKCFISREKLPFSLFCVTSILMRFSKEFVASVYQAGKKFEFFELQSLQNLEESEEKVICENLDDGIRRFNNLRNSEGLITNDYIFEYVKNGDTNLKNYPFQLHFLRANIEKNNIKGFMFKWFFFVIFIFHRNIWNQSSDVEKICKTFI